MRLNEAMILSREAFQSAKIFTLRQSPKYYIASCDSARLLTQLFAQRYISYDPEYLGWPLP